MRLIPDVVYATEDEEMNWGERQVFMKLADLDQTDSWVCLHSCNHIGNSRQSSFELDFLLITPMGFLGLEVKGGPVSRKDGIYYVGGQYGYRKHKSPYAQASDALDAFRTRFLSERFPGEFKDCLFAKAAVLIANNRPDADLGPEMPSDAVIFKEDMATSQSFKAALERAFDFAKRNLNKSKPLTPKKISAVAKAMRPDFDVSYASSSAIDAEIKRQQAFTEDQYAVLDSLSFLQRAVIDGGAGTGKTFLLERLAKTEFDAGRSVLVVTRSELLSVELRKRLTGLAEVALPDDLSESVAPRYQTLLVDEGQDLCDPEFIDLADSCLEGGLENGRWRWFGDFENQTAIGLSIDQTVYDYLLELTGNRALIPLRRNVRNAPFIVEWLKLVCKTRISDSAKGSGPEVQAISTSQLEECLKGTFELKKFGAIEKNRLVHLHVDDDDPLVQKISDAGVQSYTVEAFKGLESPIVVITGLGSLNLKEFVSVAYKAVSRARYAVLLVEDGPLNDLILEAYKNGQ